MIVLMLLFSGAAKASFVGNASIYAPAVVLGNDSGSLTRISLVITTGKGSVVINGPTSVANDTLASAITAATYASSYERLNFSRYDFTYRISDNGTNVSGPSAGAAMTILAVSAFTHVKLAPNFSMTGTINPDGTIGQVGGIYNKVQAAHATGVRFVLVPYASNGSFESSLYYLVQSTFATQLVQVTNISEAARFALYNRSIAGAATMYHISKNYSINKLAVASQECSSCNMSYFGELANFTFRFTGSEINAIQPAQNFSEAVNNLSSVLNLSEQLSAKGYAYAGANMAFLGYLDAFLFAHHTVNATAGLSTITAVQNSCDMVMPPPLTSSNYDFILGGEMRQDWANYTLTTTLSSYNLSNIENDQVLSSLYSAGEANAWCKAAQEMYNISYSIGGTPVTPSAQLGSVAYSRLSEMLSYYGNSTATAVADGDGMYVTVAETAFKEGNYPVAILDSDYAIAMAQQAPQRMPPGLILNMSEALLSKPTFGIWATQFALESRFYIQEAALHGANLSQNSSYTQQAYTTALLASRIGNDTRLISGNLIATSQNQSQQALPSQAMSEQQAQQLTAQLQSINNLLSYILIAVIVLFATNAAALAFIVATHLIHADDHKKKLQKGKRR
jgi:predicted S18 family serine protease